jgi:L-alanine-DL-glutamate epimerase-like enolase superfamily enzyme
MKMKLSRQDFLKTAALGLAGAALPLPAEAERLVASARKMVKITQVKPYIFAKALYVKIETDAGVSGWGEADHEFKPIVAQIVEQVLKPVLLGQDPFNTEYLWTQMFYSGFEGGSTGMVPGAVAGVDNALWDLKGKLVNLPVAKLLGASNLEKIEVYGSYGRRTDAGYKTPEEMAAQGLALVKEGYRTIKARMQLYDRNRNPPFNFTYDCIKAIRHTVGDQVEIFVDFNNGYTAGRAIELGLKLYEHFNIRVIEEPVSSFDYAGLHRVVDALPCEVNAGEHEYNKWQFRDLIMIGNPDAVNLDLIKCGGLSECRKIAGMSQAFEKEVMVHNTRPTLASMASLSLIGSISNAAKIQEFGGLRLDLGLAPLFHNYIRFDNGYVYLPTGPGLGLEVNEKEMEKQRLNK